MLFKLKRNMGQCPYCQDQGYVQLLLGGSETCSHCEGKQKWKAYTYTEKKNQIDLVQIKLS